MKAIKYLTKTLQIECNLQAHFNEGHTLIGKYVPDHTSRKGKIQPGFPHPCRLQGLFQCLMYLYDRKLAGSFFIANLLM